MNMRLAAVGSVLTAAAVIGCASPGAPPGGPPDKVAPKIVQVTPDSGAVNVKASSVVIRLDEVVAERPGGRMPVGGGAEGLGAIILVSPGDGREKVEWKRTAIEITPRGGFRPNTAYRITLLPGLADLRGNALLESSEIVFSTGASIPSGEISGVVFDWVGGRIAPLAAIEVFRTSDTSFRWIARADSTGRYVVRDLAPGEYRLRAWIDADNDRRLGERESFDSLRVPLDARAEVDVYAFVHDTIGPRLETVEVIDSAALRVRFDRAVALTWIPDSTALVLQRADSSVVPLGAMMPAARFDSIATVARALADSIARAADTTQRAADTARAPVRPVRPVATPDTGAVQRALPQLARPVPVRDWAVLVTAPLEPGTYRLRAVGIEGLSGTRRASEREFRIRAPAPRDTSTVAPRDTSAANAARRPPAVPPRSP